MSAPLAHSAPQVGDGTLMWAFPLHPTKQWADRGVKGNYVVLIHGTDYRCSVQLCCHGAGLLCQICGLPRTALIDTPINNRACIHGGFNADGSRSGKHNPATRPNSSKEAVKARVLAAASPPAPAPEPPTDSRCSRHGSPSIATSTNTRTPTNRNVCCDKIGSIDKMSLPSFPKQR